MPLQLCTLPVLRCPCLTCFSVFLEDSVIPETKLLPVPKLMSKSSFSPWRDRLWFTSWDLLYWGLVIVCSELWWGKFSCWEWLTFYVLGSRLTVCMFCNVFLFPVFLILSAHCSPLPENRCFLFFWDYRGKYFSEICYAQTKHLGSGFCFANVMGGI